MDINVISASGLKNVNFFMRMGVYVVVSLINGNTTDKQKTHVSNGHRNPRWNHMIHFSVQESTIRNTTLIFALHSKRVLGNRIIGEVSIPLTELLENVPGSETEEHIVEYQVRSIRGKARGTLTFSHKFKEKITPDNNNNSYPAANVYAMQQQGVPCYSHAPYPPTQGYNGYPGQPQYGTGWYPQPK
ncbi:hypothetical protein QVD17_09229 [Tagetes erecta]|uniref:C2 domain-containing protein n=1 Tax=Tagetes erecta TaxID=13708 RepID=A0AAD8P4W3_TARER|nr:hypothetical protein QVD17_09229 [Tagetes erecta]